MRNVKECEMRKVTPEQIAQKREEIISIKAFMNSLTAA